MPKPVTFQGASNFKAELFALDVSKRFRGLTPNGYYKGYGSELSCVAVLNAGYFFYISTGAALIQGRIILNDAQYGLFWGNPSANQVGAIILKIQTRPANPANCVSFRVAYASTLAGITLTQENVNSFDADTINKTYEVILYKFTVGYSGGGGLQPQNLERVLPAIDDVGYYLHRVFIQLTDYTPVYVDFLIPSAEAISNFGSLYAALRKTQPTDTKPYIACVGSNNAYYSAFYEISAAQYEAKIYVSDTTIHSREIIESDILQIRDSVFVL